MHYRAINEVIIKDPSGKGEYVHHEHKKHEWGKLNYRIEKAIKAGDYHTSYKSESSHCVSTVFNLAPMLLNFISLRGHKKILFVGHFDAAQRKLYHDVRDDAILHNLPGIHQTDLNVALQFIPIMRMAYGYDNFDLHVVQPPEIKHTHLMHDLYKDYGVDLIPANKQYKHGQQNLQLRLPPDTQYDAVILANIPREFEVDKFSYQHIQSVFQPYCKVGFEIIDLQYSDPLTRKMIGGVKQNNTTGLSQVFTNRALWDPEFRFNYNSLEYSIMDDTISVYR